LPSERDKKGRFLKGTVPNPKGRPKGSLSLTTKIRNVLESEWTDKNGDKILVAKLFAEAAVKSALKGRSQFFREIMARIDGPVTMFGAMTREERELEMREMLKMMQDATIVDDPPPGEEADA
jgi:hypothetical protein